MTNSSIRSTRVLRARNLSGMRVGRLSVISDTGLRTKENYAIWECLCDCGKSLSVPSSRLIHGYTKSCGCFCREQSSMRLKTHGMSKSKTYKIWANAKHRCENSRHRVYASYGGRGIYMEKRWADSFEEFLKDMGEKPDGLTLDRVNNDGPYAHYNCRWATRSEQQRNKRPFKWRKNR